MRYIIVLLDPGDGEVITHGTNDVTSTVRDIVLSGYDVACEQEEEAICQLSKQLIENGSYMGEDGSRQLILVDTHNLDHER